MDLDTLCIKFWANGCIVRYDILVTGEPGRAVSQQGPRTTQLSFNRELTSHQTEYWHLQLQCWQILDTPLLCSPPPFVIVYFSSGAEVSHPRTDTECCYSYCYCILRLNHPRNEDLELHSLFNASLGGQKLCRNIIIELCHTDYHYDWWSVV